VTRLIFVLGYHILPLQGNASSALAEIVNEQVSRSGAEFAEIECPSEIVRKPASASPSSSEKYRFTNVFNN
jgi:hypothetical protein